jgi:hypothetical protein
MRNSNDQSTGARCSSPRSREAAFARFNLSPLTFYSQTDYDYDYDYEHEFFIRLPRRCVVKAGASTSHFSPFPALPAPPPKPRIGFNP